MELTNREAGMMQCVYSGMQNKQIAAFYGISTDTVKNNITHVLEKIDKPDRTNAALWWWRYAVQGDESPLFTQNPCGVSERESGKKYATSYRKIPKELWSEILDKHGNKCLACGSKEDITRDHVVPISKGGSLGPENIQPLCKKCNSRKGNKAIDYR